MTDIQRKARRGDGVIVGTRHTEYTIPAPGRTESYEYESYEVGTVTGITRAGLVRTWRPAWADAETKPSLDRDHRHLGVWLLPAAEIDVDGAVATAACHVWEGHEQARPYGSLDEVRAAMAPHRKSAPTCETLAEAAAGWQLARMAADRMLRDDQTAANRHAAIGYETRMDRAALDRWSERVALANMVYRATYAGVTAMAGDAQ
jgi:hypothetical protein